MKMSNFCIQIAIFFFITITICNAQTCKPSGSLKGRNVPRSECNPKTADCCQVNKSYDTYTCSPPVVKGGQTKAVLTQNSFEDGGDGGGPSECDNRFHSDSTQVVALSTGWFQHKSRCGKMITIHGNGRTTTAKVVDECDSTRGCDDEHGYQAPCHYNIVDASDAVWKALGVTQDDPQYGQMDITWSEN